MLKNELEPVSQDSQERDSDSNPGWQPSSTSLTGLLQLAERGWRLHPYKTRDKTPLTRWKTTASSDPDVIERWYRSGFPGCNWGVVCGPESGVWVLDVDGDRGCESLAGLIAEHGPLPRTLTSLTGRGKHLWFNYPCTGQIRTSVGKLRPALDVRAYGGCAIVPPSIHPSGRQYLWEDLTIPAADAPEWLVQLVASPMHSNRERSSGEILPVGKRNRGLTTLAGRLRRRGATEAEILATLKSENLRLCSPPLPRHELASIAQSIAQYPAGGPDILDRAWATTQQQVYSTRYETFLALVGHLHRAQDGRPVALPVQRIGRLLRVDHTLVARYRRRAVAAGLLVQTQSAVRGRRAAYFQAMFPDVPVTGVEPESHVPVTRVAVAPVPVTKQLPVPLDCPNRSTKWLSGTLADERYVEGFL